MPAAATLSLGEDLLDVDELLATLSVEEKAALTAGADMWTVGGLPARGIPAIRMTDGPNGARGSSLLGAGRLSAACVPCGSALGATWDPALIELVGEVLGEEARTKGARLLLAPTVNLHRSPLAGRNFECYSEDPLLSGRTATGFIRGVQSRGVAATVKHLVGNESEFERLTISSDISERALRELYLVPFELAVRDAGVLAVMTSYNRVNGTWCAEDPHLLTDILRGEFGFTGVVMTDWFAVGSTVASARAGLDLQMPGPDRFYGRHLAAAVHAGEVDPALLDAMARRWLGLVDRLDAWQDEPQAEQAVDLPAHREIARRAAAESTVLLSNRGLLPLAGTERIALIGPNADRAHIMGGGSAQLRAHRLDTLAQVLRRRLGDRVVVEPGCLVDKTPRAVPTVFETVFRDLAGTVVGTTEERDGRLLWFTEPVAGLDPERFTFTARGRLAVTSTGRHRFTMVQAGRGRVSVNGKVVIDGFATVPPQGTDLFGLGSVEVEGFVDLVAGEVAEVVIDYSTEGSVVLHGLKVGLEPPASADLLDRAVAAAAQAQVAVVVVGTTEEWESEGHDRTDLHLPGAQDELVRRVCEANPRTVVVVNAGTVVAMDWAEQAGAVLLPWLGGQEMAEALADVLLGDAEPAGRLPVTVPVRVEHTPSFGSFPGENHHVSYGESLLVGYRWYDSRHLPTVFPFGHGGSYTTFSWGPARLSTQQLRPGGEVLVEVPVTNTGARRGAEVVQLYVEPPPSRLFRPRRELKAFQKVWLAPGETAVVRLRLTGRAFAFWDGGSTETAHLAERLGDGSVVPAEQGAAPPDRPGWHVQGGPHALLLGTSVERVLQRLEVDLGWTGRLDGTAE